MERQDFSGKFLERSFGNHRKKNMFFLLFKTNGGKVSGEQHVRESAN